MLERLPFKTLDEHRDYLYQIVRLKLNFLHYYLRTHPEETFRDVIRNRVDIYRKTEANPGALNPPSLCFDKSPWLNMEQAAEAIYKENRDDAETFERKAFQVFQASIDARCERDYSDPSVLSRYQCGSLRHELQLDPDGRTMHFHIANSVAPRSIFADPEHLKTCFTNLMNITEKVYGGTQIGTGTWLNQNPKWLSLFPKSWIEHMSAPNTNIQWHYGFWGQFITARGTFNYKAGEYLRKTHRLPYYPCSSWCTIEDMRAKLAESR